MYLFEIINFFKEKKLKNVFVLPCDMLPREKIKKLPAGFVVNLSPSNHPGTHWIAIAIDKDQNGTYFCSYGMDCEVDEIQKFLIIQCKTVNYNKRQIQQMKSRFCGEHCAVFLFYHLWHHISLHDYIELFCINPTINDYLIRKRFERLLNHRN
jgi:hypothetical protein